MMRLAQSFRSATARNLALAMARFIVVLAIAFALSSAIDPYLELGSPILAQAINAVVPIIVVLLVWAATGRAWLALLVEVVLLELLLYADQLKVMYLNTDLVYADFTVLGGLLKDPHLVLGFVHPTRATIAAVVAAVVAIVLIAWFTRRRRHAGWKFRATCGVLAIAGIVGIALARIPASVDALQWQVFSQATGAQQVGIAGNILLGRMSSANVNRPPDPAAERAFWQEPAVRAALQRADAAGKDTHPDIVILQSESLFEPSQLCGFANTPVLKHVAAEQPYSPGNLHVPVFGGRTLQTEFEVLTGAPISYYPGSMFAYYELVKHPFDALPRVLDGLGYRTVAIHPDQRGFWRRDIVFPEMGFDTFQDIGSFVYPRDYSDRNFVSDEALTRAILAELDSSNRQTFVMAISMNNHGPWGQYAPKNDAGLGLPDNLHGVARRQLADYVEHAIDADNAYGFLLDALQRRGRPTVVVMYGDHMPALSRVYDKLCFKGGAPAERHWPPYRIWANFPMPQPPMVTDAYLLQGWLLHVAGLPLKGQVLANFLAGEVDHDPSISAEVKQRVLSEYANIAAANVAREAPPLRNAATVFVGEDNALSMLMKHRVGAMTGVSVDDGALAFAPAANRPAQLALKLDGALASLTLRPYWNGALKCRGSGPRSAGAEINVTGDGRELYRASLTRQTFRLATLNVQGVKRLDVGVSGMGADGDCDRASVQVAQMLCFSAGCDAPGPPPPPGSPVDLPSRILTHDPIAGDIAHLASMTPLYRRQVAGKLANVDWMLGRETAKQTGQGAFSVQVDGRLFMPPAPDHSAWITFNVEGLDSIELSPRINPLTPYCLSLDKPDTRVGVVKLELSLDGKPLQPPLTIDPRYDQNLQLDVNGGRTLKIAVEKGSSVNWCDWFAVGFPKLEGPAAPVPKPVSAPITSTPAVAPPPFVTVAPTEGDAVQRDYPSAAQEAAFGLDYPLFLAYGPNAARIAPFFPGTSSQPVSVWLLPAPAGYQLRLLGHKCAFPVAYQLRAQDGKLLAHGDYSGTQPVDLADWDAESGAAILNLRMGDTATNNWNCNFMVARRK